MMMNGRGRLEETPELGRSFEMLWFPAPMVITLYDFCKGSICFQFPALADRCAIPDHECKRIQGRMTRGQQVKQVKQGNKVNALISLYLWLTINEIYHLSFLRSASFRTSPLPTFVLTTSGRENIEGQWRSYSSCLPFRQCRNHIPHIM